MRKPGYLRGKTRRKFRSELSSIVVFRFKDMSPACLRGVSDRRARRSFAYRLSRLGKSLCQTVAAFSSVHVCFARLLCVRFETDITSRPAGRPRKILSGSRSRTNHTKYLRGTSANRVDDRMVSVFLLSRGSKLPASEVGFFFVCLCG